MSTIRPSVPDGRGRCPGLPAGGQVRRLALSGTRGVVARSRDFTREALVDWKWLPARDEEGQAVAEDVLLVVSELVTNACLHAGGPQELLLHCTDRGLRIEVSDRSADRPQPRSPHLRGRPGGHGLHIIERLTRHWGVVGREYGPGKTVWVEIPSPFAA